MTIEGARDDGGAPADATPRTEASSGASKAGADDAPAFAVSGEADAAKKKKRRKKERRQLTKLAARVEEAVGLLTALERRLARIERAQRETVEATDRLRRAVRTVEASMATKGDAKKLKKMLDQLEVVEIADDALGRPPAEEE